MPIRIRQSAPQVIQEILPLPQTLVPEIPRSVRERWPEFDPWMREARANERKLFAALQDSNRTVSQTTTAIKRTTDILGVELIERFDELEDEVGNLFGKYTLAVVAGDVVTGMVLTSATGDTPISDVTFQASSFKIYNNVTGISMFDVSGSDVRLAGTLVVSTSGKVYIGTGTWGNSNTSFYVDDAGQFSLKDKLTWNGTTLAINGVITSTSGTIGGFTIGATTLSAGSGLTRVALSSASGSIELGTSATSLFGLGSGGFLLTNNNVPAAALGSVGATGEGIITLRNSAGSTVVTLSGASGTVDATNFNGPSNIFTVKSGSDFKLGKAATLTADTPIVGYVPMIDSNGNTIHVAII
jgi:hypothetical protein